MGEADEMLEDALRIVKKHVPVLLIVCIATALCLPLDEPVEKVVSEYRTPQTVRVAEAVTVIGNVYYGIPTLLGIVFLARRKDFRRALLAVLMAVTAAFIIKGIVSRQRPIPAGKFDAYPSGHTAASFSLFGVLAESTRRRRVLIVPAMVGISRIVLGRHYLSDVVMGAGIGIVMAMASGDILKLIRSRA